MLRKLRTDKSGFTLIELMIVIAIIGILAAIAIPNFIAYRNKSFCSRAESDANNIAGSVADYFSIPVHTALDDASYKAYATSFKPSDNSFTISANSPNNAVTITVTDASKRCPDEWVTKNPINADGNGWAGTAGVDAYYQKVVKNQ